MEGESATGETSCTASHLLMDKDEVLIWHLRYQEVFRKTGEHWKFARRRILIDWTETVPVSLPDPPG